MAITEAHVLMCAGAILDSALRNGMDQRRGCEMAASLAWELADRVTELKAQERRVVALPHDPEAERILLSTFCASGATGGTRLDALVAETDPDVFFVPAHRLIFGALQACLSQGQEVGLHALAAVLESQGAFGRVRGYPGLLEMISGDEVVRPEAIVQRLQELQRRREMIRKGGDLIRNGADLTRPLLEDGL